jgi:hypothetical protein
MYCRFCGKEVKDKAIVCTGCGRPVDLPRSLVSSTGKGWSFGMMVGLIAATVFFPPIGLVFGVRGLMDERKKVQAAVLLTVSVFMSLLATAIILGL